MDLEEEFKQTIHSLNELYSEVIIPYITSCLQSLSDFVKEKTHIYIRFQYHNTERILQGLYKVGVENCQKEYDYYNSILKFKQQFEIDYQIMKQTKQKWFNTELGKFTECQKYSFQQYMYSDRILISKKDMKFYINKYKFYNSFKITLS